MIWAVADVSKGSGMGHGRYLAFGLHELQYYHQQDGNAEP